MTQEMQGAYRYASTLLMSLIRKHYPDLPDFKPLPDLMGVLTQLDNISTGMARFPLPEGYQRVTQRYLNAIVPEKPLQPNTKTFGPSEYDTQRDGEAEGQRAIPRAGAVPIDQKKYYTGGFVGHNGGFVGLKPGEVPAILSQGETRALDGFFTGRSVANPSIIDGASLGKTITVTVTHPEALAKADAKFRELTGQRLRIDPKTDTPLVDVDPTKVIFD